MRDIKIRAVYGYFRKGSLSVNAGKRHVNQVSRISDPRLSISDSLRLRRTERRLVIGSRRSARPVDAPIFTRQKRIGDMQCLALTDRRLEIPKPGRGNVDETIGGAADGATLLGKQNELDPHPVQVPA